MDILLVENSKSLHLSKLFSLTVIEYFNNDIPFLKACIDKLSEQYALTAIYSVESMTLLPNIALIIVNTNIGKFTFRFNKKPGNVVEFDIQEANKSQIFTNVGILVVT